jgi:hypothetical protein
MRQYRSRHLAALSSRHLASDPPVQNKVEDFSKNRVDNLKRCFHHIGVNQRLAEVVGWSLQKLIRMRSRHIVSRRSTPPHTSVPNTGRCVAEAPLSRVGIRSLGAQI